MNAVCLLDVLSGSLSICSTQTQVTGCSSAALPCRSNRCQERQFPGLFSCGHEPSCSNNVFVNPCGRITWCFLNSKHCSQRFDERRWTSAPLFSIYLLQRHPGSLRNVFQSFLKRVCGCMKGLMKKSINRPGTARWVINKTLKESFQKWLYAVCPHWVKAIYLCFFLTPAISASIPLGLQIKEGSLWTKRNVWQSSDTCSGPNHPACSGSINQRPAEGGTNHLVTAASLCHDRRFKPLGCFQSIPGAARTQ